MTLDPAALQVLIARLTAVADEMGAVLRRAAFSPNIKERSDCSAAVFDAEGNALAQADHIPVHLGSMPASVAAVIARFGPDGDDRLGPGEQAVVNDPFEGGTHLNDITVVAPCWVGPPGEMRLVGWVANRAHHADVGGAAPGSLPADATDIHQEGLRIPPTRMTPAVRDLVLANSRTPHERAGDLDAQVGANVVGVRRLAELAGSSPGGGLPGGPPFDEVLDHGERRCLAVLGDLPEGEWSAADVLDSTGPTEAQQRPATLRCTVRVLPGPAIEFDFTGTEAQRLGNTNAVASVTASAVGFALRAVLDHTLPANAGVMRPVRVVAPEGTLVAARYPAAVGAGNVEVSQRIADVCRLALAGVVPDRVAAADQGTMNNVLIGGGPASSGVDDRVAWVYYETVAGGQGGRPPDPDAVGSRPHAGMSGVHTGMTDTDQVDYRSVEPRPGQSGIHTAMTNTRNTPIEALERAFPLRVLRYRLRRGSGGAGRAPGGEGIERDLQVLEDATVSLITERRVSQPWGLAGGEPGAPGENWLLPAGDEARAQRLADKCTIELHAGDVVRMLTPGGGGWGAVPMPKDI